MPCDRSRKIAPRVVLAVAFALVWPAAARDDRPVGKIEHEDRQLVAHFPQSVLHLRAGDQPAVVALLLARHPELRFAGGDRDGALRFLVSPEYAERIPDYRRTLTGLSGTVGKILPSPRIEGLQKARLLARSMGQADVVGLIVKYRDAEMRKRATDAMPLDGAELQRLTRITGARFEGSRAMSGESYVAHLSVPTDLHTGELLSQRLAMAPDVERVDLNTIQTVALTPNDQFFSLQWSLSSSVAGIRAPQAWDITTGSANVVVAVVDTGLLAHPDLSGRILPGIDTITSATTSNDGDGRDNNATDSGSYASAGSCESPVLERSSWHGTHVAGIIAANGNNGIGIAGVDWRARILPIRVLGRCGSGTAADIADGIRWAAGISVPGLPLNPAPARVINASLAGRGSCSVYTTVLMDVLERGSLVVAAAGNNNDNALEYMPASCALALTVSAVARNGDKATYSNYSPLLEIAAPGGEGLDSDAIGSTFATGTQGSPEQYDYYYRSGTSQAAPHVAGVASLMLSVAPGMTVAQMRDVIQETARPFPAGSRCATQRDCATGILDAAAAVTRARALNGIRTNYSALWWQPNEDGWGINFQQQGDVVFGTWFSYVASGRGIWYVMPSLARVSGDVFSGDILVTTGVPFNQISGQQSLRSYQVAGTATIYFFEKDKALMLVTANGSLVMLKQILLQEFGTVPTCDFTTGSRAGLRNYQDIWWVPSESGWGLNLAHQGNLIFATWYTYGPDGLPLWLVSTLAQNAGTNTFAGAVLQTTGRPPQDISGTQSLIGFSAVGSMTLSFSSGERGTFAYTVFGQSGSKSIERQTWSSPLSQCR